MAQLSETFAKATYRRLEGVFLLGYAAGDEQIRGEQEARGRCDELGAACGGFTCTEAILVEPRSSKSGYAAAQAAQSCTVRAPGELFESPKKELSYLKVLPSSGLAKAVERRTAKEDASEVFQFYTGSQSIVRKVGL